MKNLISLLVVLVTTAAVVFGSYGSVAFAASQYEGGDLCGGTGGNGQIIRIGNNAFTLKLNDGGQKGSGNLIVNLTSHATIETLTGYVSLSGLKIGDRVTLVGDNNRDGTFTADAVVVCSEKEVIGTEVNRASRTPITVRNGNTEAYEKVSSVINAVTIFFVGFIWFGIVAFLKLKKGKSFVYLLFFTIFYIYLYKVLDYTLLQFQSLLLLQHFLPNLILNGISAGRTVNVIPLVTLRLVDVETSLLNILMMIPFGFGLPFISNFRMKKVVTIGLLLSIIIESLQFVTGFMSNTTFRIADVNDLIFNTMGVAIGYQLFVGFVRNYRKIFRNSRALSNPILRYIAERSQIDRPR